jgi:hypothetical protein
MQHTNCRRAFAGMVLLMPESVFSLHVAIERRAAAFVLARCSTALCSWPRSQRLARAVTHSWVFLHKAQCLCTPCQQLSPAAGPFFAVFPWAFPLVTRCSHD